ncbi:MAG: SAF domain-containing protein [Pseudonocardia sp.]|uniref:SAF domain-containing protein n=1 Tax=Pseudonocardia sp. TaxID=60912 RepID=UPI001AD31FAA|nr:SAF domain-containing protein [Pseudonocardia sp.]MBN9097984.1 SAF domain-containing protein [Pseudonocardia sp.]
MRTILPTREPRVDIPGDAAYVEADPWPARPAASPGGRRSVPHLLLGVLLVLACAVGALVVTVQFGGSRMVLATARAVGVGQVLSASDVRQVSLPADSDIRAVDASAAPTLIGRLLAVALPAGAVLTPESFSGAGTPPAGQAIVAVALDPGRLPAEVAPGDQVSVVVAAVATVGAVAVDRAAARSWPAVVTSVAPSDTGRLTMVSVQLPEASAREVAAVPSGQVALVLVAAGG